MSDLRVTTSPTMVRHLTGAPNQHGRHSRTLCGVAIKGETLGRAGWSTDRETDAEDAPVDCLKCSGKRAARLT